MGYDMNVESKTIYRACNLCEAICGLEIEIAGGQIIRIRGDDADPFSRGHICPKAVALKDIHEDPDRLRQPVQKIDGEWHPIAWEDAFELAADRLAKVIEANGNDAVAIYAGNPNVHNFGHLINIPPIAKLIRSKNIYSASSVDQLPQQLVSYLMFGHQFLIPIPDIDHTDYFLILGANPIASNGSMMTVPDVAKRLKAIQLRGGKIVVIDPRLTETAEVASEHHFIRPGSDAAFLAAILNTIVANKKIADDRWCDLDSALAAIADFTPANVAEFVGIDAAAIQRIANEFVAAKSAVCYGRMGTTTQAFGSLNQWLIYLINIVSGNLDRVGGALVTTPLMPITGSGTRAGGHARWHSRVRRLAETNGELPVATLAEEILTEGQGQVRALISIAGNPILSTPNGKQLDLALRNLDFMLSVDIYINETTLHADLILPPTSALNHDHYDSVFNAFAVHNTARINDAIWLRPDEERYDWEIFAAIGARLTAKLGREYSAPPTVRDIIANALKHSPFNENTTMTALQEAKHGLDLGALRPSLYDRLETAGKKIHCAPDAILADIPRLREAIKVGLTSTLSLIGRRHVRSNNSWMHNSHRLVKGKPRHQLLMHPADMAARNIQDHSIVRVTTRVGEVTIKVESSNHIMPGVVSLPHGFGHQRDGVKLQIAQLHAGVSANDLTDDYLLDAVSGNAALNGAPVEVSAM
jgi:anaerobic selenocysteine-containing dehydrogenase